MLQAVKPFNVHQNKQVNANQNKQNNKVGFGMQDYELQDLANRLEESSDTFQQGTQSMQQMTQAFVNSQNTGLNALGHRLTTQQRVIDGQMTNFDGRLGKVEKIQTVHGNRLNRIGSEVRQLKQQTVPQIQRFQTLEEKFLAVEAQNQALLQKLEEQSQMISDLRNQQGRHVDTIQLLSADNKTLHETLGKVSELLKQKGVIR